MDEQPSLRSSRLLENPAPLLDREIRLHAGSLTGHERLEQSAESIAFRYLPWMAAVCVAFYLVMAIFSASHHRLWFDEVNTAWLSHLPVEQLWEALKNGADTNPLIFYLPVRQGYLLGLSEELATRMPSILEFLLLMVCIFLLLRRYVSGIYALLAAFFPFLTAAGIYATEGRGYAALLGFSSAALLCWRTAALGIYRKRALCGLALSLAMAVSNHYSAALIVVALAAGECTRCLQKKQIDLAIWLAIGCGVLPLVFFQPLLPAIRVYLLSYWSKPSFHEMWLAMEGWKWALLVLAFLGGLIVMKGYLPQRIRDRKIRGLNPPLFEQIAWFAVLCSPIYGYLQGRITGGFTMRYALIMAIPAALFAGILAYRAFRGLVLPAMLLLALFLSLVAERMIVPVRRPLPFEAQATWINESTAALGGAVIVGDPVVFSPMYFYSVEPFRARLHYVTDPALSTRFLGMNSGDLNLNLLRHFAPIPVSDYSNISSLGKHFYVVQDESSWLIQQLKLEGADIRTIAHRGAWRIEEVDLRR